MSGDAAEDLAAPRAPDDAARSEILAAAGPIYHIDLEFPAAQMPHWKALGEVTGARRRAKRVAVIWHDTPDNELAKHQLALSEQAGIWRLVALRPGKHGWPPASLPPVIAEAADQADLGLGLGLALTFAPAPVASFVGVQRNVEIAGEAGNVAAAWISGNLRAVVDEIAVARIELAGPREALRAMASQLAEQGASVPLASTAAQAIALAEHAVPAARHKGAAEVPGDTNVADGLAFAIGQLVDAALYWAARISTATDPEPVHQMRVAVRRLRSLLSAPRKPAVGPLWLATKSMLGDLARELGEAREWDVFLHGVGAEMAQLWPQDRRIGLLLARARKRRDAGYATLRDDLASARMRRIAVELALFAKLRPFEAEGDPEFWAMDCREFAVEALTRLRRKLFASGDDLTPLAPLELHELRKKAKRLRYGGELFASFWNGKAARKYLERIGELQEALGQVNDAASLEQLLAGLGARGFAAGVAVGIAAAHAKPALKQAQAVWRKLVASDEYWK